MNCFEDMILEALLTDIAEHVFRHAPDDTPAEVFSLIYDYISWIHLGPHRCAWMIEDADIRKNIIRVHPFYPCSVLSWYQHGLYEGVTFYCARCGDAFQTATEEPGDIPVNMFCPGCPMHLV